MKTLPDLKLGKETYCPVVLGVLGRAEEKRTCHKYDVAAAQVVEAGELTSHTKLFVGNSAYLYKDATVDDGLVVVIYKRG